jgi:hypothetical protein
VFRRISAVLVLGLSLAAFTTLAQDSEPQRVTEDGFSFDWLLAQNIRIDRVPADPPEYGPGFAEPAFMQFLFSDGLPEPVSIGDAIGGLRVYETANFEDYSEHGARLEALIELLDERPDLDEFEVLHTENMNANALPFIPVYAAGQVIRARTEYIETDDVQGIAYLTVYQEATEPFERALWTFQGISTDGDYYVAAIFNVTSDVFPEDTSGFVVGRFNEYRAKMVRWLNDADPESFEPALPTLEALVESIKIEA